MIFSIISSTIKKVTNCNDGNRGDRRYEKLIYVKIRFIGVLFLLILFNSITVFAAGNEEYFRSVFDPDYYYNQYPDLQGQLGNDSEALFHHFMTIGVREGRSGNAEFNLRAYVLHNRDLLDYYKTESVSLL